MVEESEVLLKLFLGYSSTRKIAKSLGVKHSRVHRLIKELVKRKLVEKDGFKGFKLTETGKALIEREKAKSPITLEKFIIQIQTLSERLLNAEDEETRKKLRIIGLRYVLDGTAFFVNEIISELSEKITHMNMRSLIEEKYAGALKELIASASTFCLGLGKVGWDAFHKEMVDKSLRLQGCLYELGPFIKGTEQTRLEG